MTLTSPNRQLKFKSEILPRKAYAGHTAYIWRIRRSNTFGAKNLRLSILHQTALALTNWPEAIVEM